MYAHLLIIALIILCTILIIHSCKTSHRRGHMHTEHCLTNRAHTWTDGSGSSYSNKYHAMDHGENFVSMPITSYARAKMGNFSNTLQRRMGMGSAGASVEKYSTNPYVGTFDAVGETFTAGNDVAAGTMYSGYMERTTLPG